MVYLYTLPKQPYFALKIISKIDSIVTSADIMALFGVKWLKRPIIMPNRSLIPHFNHPTAPYTSPLPSNDMPLGHPPRPSSSGPPWLIDQKILTLKCIFFRIKINNRHMHASGIPWIYFLALSIQIATNLEWFMNPK